MIFVKSSTATNVLMATLQANQIRWISAKKSAEMESTFSSTGVTTETTNQVTVATFTVESSVVGHVPGETQ